MLKHGQWLLIKTDNNKFQGVKITDTPETKLKLSYQRLIISFTIAAHVRQDNDYDSRVFSFYMYMYNTWLLNLLYRGELQISLWTN